MIRSLLPVVFLSLLAGVPPALAAIPGQEGLPPALPDLSTLVDPAPGPGSHVPLGRRNPFRPLVGVESELPPAAAGGASVDLPSLPAGVLPMVPMADPAAPAYVGIAYDGRDAIAAVRSANQTYFLRRGEKLAEGVVIAITPEKLIWRKNGQTVTSPLQHPSTGAP